MSMNISLIIPTYNAQKYLPTLLNKLKEQSTEFELIIIDSSSTDNTVEIAKEYTDNITIIPQKEFDHGGTRTKAAKIAKGDILVYLTQDALLFNDNSIELLIKPFTDKQVGVCYGRQIAYSHSGVFGTFLRLFNYPTESNERVYADKQFYGLRAAFLSNSFSAYRRSHLEEVGYFEDKLILSEDMLAAANILRVGYKICYAAEAKVYHSHDYTVIEEFRRYFDIGVFHALKPDLQKEFGSAEGEGKRFVKKEFQYLIETNNYHLIPLSFVRNGSKLLAYKLGKNYKKLPNRIVPLLSMYQSWWLKNKLKEKVL